MRRKLRNKLSVKRADRKYVRNEMKGQTWAFYYLIHSVHCSRLFRVICLFLNLIFSKPLGRRLMSSATDFSLANTQSTDAKYSEFDLIMTNGILRSKNAVSHFLFGLSAFLSKTDSAVSCICSAHRCVFPRVFAPSTFALKLHVCINDDADILQRIFSLQSRC